MGRLVVHPFETGQTCFLKCNLCWMGGQLSIHSVVSHQISSISVHQISSMTSVTHALIRLPRMHSSTFCGLTTTLGCLSLMSIWEAVLNHPTICHPLKFFYNLKIPARPRHVQMLPFQPQSCPLELQPQCNN